MSEIYFNNPKFEFGNEFFRFWQKMDEDGVNQTEFVGRKEEISTTEISLSDKRGVFKMTLKDGRTIRLGIEKEKYKNTEYETLLRFYRFGFYEKIVPVVILNKE